MQRVDCRGLSCPEPVVETKKAIKGASSLEVVVDNVAAKENVKRFATALGYNVDIKEEGNDYILSLKK